MAIPLAGGTFDGQNDDAAGTVAFKEAHVPEIFGLDHAASQTSACRAAAIGSLSRLGRLAASE